MNKLLRRTNPINEKDKINDLIKSKEWMELQQFLSSEVVVGNVGRDHRIQPVSAELTSVLHIACAHAAPLFIVKRLVELFPWSLYQPDNIGRTPLHVATSSLAPLHVIKYLTRNNPDGASSVDTKGRTPLMTFCQEISSEVNVANQMSRTLGEKSDAKMLGVVNALCQAAPHSVLFTDTTGTGAFKYAEDGGAPKSVLLLLKEKYYTAQKGLFSLCIEPDENSAISSLTDTLFVVSGVHTHPQAWTKKDKINPLLGCSTVRESRRNSV